MNPTTITPTTTLNPKLADLASRHRLACGEWHEAVSEVANIQAALKKAQVRAAEATNQMKSLERDYMAVVQS